MKSSTEVLRAMLDERGVEWEACRVPTLRSELAATFWYDRDGNPCSAVEGADDVPDGKLGVNASLTPEQAIEATLGRGECRDSNNRFNAWQCSECGATVLLMFDDYDEPTYSVNGVADVPKYCPNCGRVVRA